MIILKPNYLLKALAKLNLHIVLERKFFLRTLTVYCLYMLADLMITAGLICGNGWGCYIERSSNETLCDVDFGYRWSYRGEVVLSAVVLGTLGLVLQCLVLLNICFSCIFPTITEYKPLLMLRLVVALVAAYLIIVAVILYVGGYSRLEAQLTSGMPNVVNSFGHLLFVTFIGWVLILVAVTYDVCGIIAPLYYETETDAFFRHWLHKFNLYIYNKYVVFNLRDIPICPSS